MTRIRTLAMAVALATVGGWFTGTSGWAPLAAPGAAATTTATRPCNVVPHPLTPRTITIKGITKRAKIVTPPRLAGRVPGAPPLTEAGKEQFAWDKASGIRPGDDHGKVRLNAHVWPDGSAVGNRMLKNLFKGDRIVVFGKTLKLCYRVTDRIQVRASSGLDRYYDLTGKPRLAIVTCSGKRLGPGVWTHRTVWFAKPKL